jgi:hypothetical protein
MPIAALRSSQQGRFKAVQQKYWKSCGNGFSQGLVIAQPQITLQPNHRNFHILKTLGAAQGFKNMKKLKELPLSDIDRIMKKSSFKMWRARVQGRSTKHSKKAPEDLLIFKSRMQKGIALNKMPKR